MERHTFRTLTPNAQVVWCKRYASRLGELVLCESCEDKHETMEHFLDRVSFHREEFKELINSLAFLPNSPTLFNAGIPNSGSLSACFVLEVPDTMPGILDVAKYSGMIQKFGGGVGYYLTPLRGKGAPIRSTHGRACGPVSVMGLYHSVAKMITQGGKRAGAQMAVLDANHPDISEFIHCKDENPQDLSTFNISVRVTDAFMERAIDDTESDEARILNEIASSCWRSGDPGMIFANTVDKHQTDPWMGKWKSTNPCVTEDTWVMTVDGPLQVKDLVGKPFVALIHGTAYASTQEGFWSSGIKDCIRINTKEGFSLECTSDHKIYLIDGTTKSAGDLVDGDVIRLHDQCQEWIGNGHTGNQGYLLGLLIGDGHFSESLKGQRACVAVWNNDNGSTTVMERAETSIREFPVGPAFKGFRKANNSRRIISTKYFTDFASEFGIVRGNKTITPAIEMASSEFYKGFLSGLFDADGTVADKRGYVNVRLSQSNMELLESVQRMLHRLGIRSQIYRNRKPAGMQMLPDGHGSLGEYQVKASHDLNISGIDVFRFSEKVGFTHSAKAFRLESAINSFVNGPKHKESVVRFLESTDIGQREVFDCTVPGPHAFDGNGMYLANCGEVSLPNFGSCNLGSINLLSLLKDDNSVDYDKLRAVTDLAVRYLDIVVNENHFPIPEIADLARDRRNLGLGVMGLADLLAAMHVHYDSVEARDIAHDIWLTIKDQAYITSDMLGQIWGPAPAFNHPDSYGRTRRNTTLLCIAPTGTISILAGVSSGIEPHYALENTRLTGDGMILKELVNSNGFIPKTAMEIEWLDHVKMAAVFHNLTDTGVSKTINLPNTATVEDIRQAYVEAWKHQMMAVSLFRDGCRGEQILNSDICPECSEISMVRKDGCSSCINCGYSYCFVA